MELYFKSESPGDEKVAGRGESRGAGVGLSSVAVVMLQSVVAGSRHSFSLFQP